MLSHLSLTFAACLVCHCTLIGMVIGFPACQRLDVVNYIAWARPERRFLKAIISVAGDRRYNRFALVRFESTAALPV